MKMAVISAIFAAASFGYWLSVVLSGAAIVLIVKNRQEFYI